MLGSALTCSGAYFLSGDCVASVVLKAFSLTLEDIPRFTSGSCPFTPWLLDVLPNLSTTTWRSQCRKKKPTFDQKVDVVNFSQKKLTMSLFPEKKDNVSFFGGP